jgi:hypothetical protein
MDNTSPRGRKAQFLIISTTKTRTQRKKRKNKFSVIPNKGGNLVGQVTVTLFLGQHGMVMQTTTDTTDRRFYQL